VDDNTRYRRFGPTRRVSGNSPRLSLMTIPSGRYSRDVDTSTARTVRTIIEAVNRIVRRDGVARLTLDAVAREARLSKGGLLYHFASKNALIAGMTAALLADFEGNVRRRSGTDDEETGRWLRAYVLATADDEPADEPGARDETAALIAAIATSPDLMAPLQQRYALWQQQAEAALIGPHHWRRGRPEPERRSLTPACGYPPLAAQDQ